MSSNLRDGNGDFINRWKDVDGDNSADEYSTYLNQVTSLESAQMYKRISFRMMALSGGDKVLDVGCGTGDDVRELATFVGNSGKVIGIDVSQDFIDQANENERTDSLPVEFRQGTAYSIPFDDNHFDSTRADRVFQHLERREDALQEMMRVTKPGCRICVIDPDWHTLIVDAREEGELAKRILNYIAENSAQHDGAAGRQNYGLFKDAGLANVVVEPVSIHLSEIAIAGPVLHLTTAPNDMVNSGLISEEDRSRWIDTLNSLDASERFFSSITGFIVSGVNPG